MQTIKSENLDSSISATNFTYSIWFFIEDWNYRFGQEKIIFGRMGNPGAAPANPCPLVTLGDKDNTLTIYLALFNELTTLGGNTIPTSTVVATAPLCADESSSPSASIKGRAPSSGLLSKLQAKKMRMCSDGVRVAKPYQDASCDIDIHQCKINNIPIQKWVNLLFTTYNRSMDVYLDGKLVQTCILAGLPNLVDKSANVYITPQGGFAGYTSTFQFLPFSCDPQRAWNIYRKGYGSNLLSNIIGKYQVKVAVLENGVEGSSLTV